MEHNIRIERVYDDPAGTTGGYRVLVDRLWPRGESKKEFHYDLWAKDVAPSTGLREWFHADRTDRWQDFQKKYEAELESNPGVVDLAEILRRQPDIVLLTAARDVDHSHVPILSSYIGRKIS